MWTILWGVVLPSLLQAVCGALGAEDPPVACEDEETLKLLQMKGRRQVEKDPKPELQASSVLVFRHCPRSTHANGIVDVPGFDYYNNYSEEEWPLWPVPAMHCLPRGLDILQAQGRFLKSSLPGPIFVIADTVFRDNQTAHALLEGFDMLPSNKTLLSIHAPFSNSSTCKYLSGEKSLEALKESMSRIPNPASYSTVMTKLSEILGPGAAGNWSNYSCEAYFDESQSKVKMRGACYAASDFVERLFMEWAGGLTLGWNKLIPSELPSLMRLHDWARTVYNAVPPLEARLQASISHWVLKGLERPGTTVFAGHDTTLNALQAILGLSWIPTPWPPNATMPASALRFDRVGKEVNISYIYVQNYSEETGVMATVPVTTLFGDAFGSLSWSEFKHLAKRNTVKDCVNVSDWPLVEEEGGTQ